MGVIRSGLFVITSVLLFFVFLAGNIFLTLNLSLDYEYVKPELVSVIKDVVEKEINLMGGTEEILGLMELSCQNNSIFTFNDSVSGYVFEIPCETVAEGSEAVINYQINDFVEKVYYEDYNCNFINCLKELEYPSNSLFFVSEKAKDYWKNKFYLTLIISIVLIVLIFFLIEQKPNLPIVVGSMLAISALPFMKLNWIFSFVSGITFLQFFTVFFTKAYTVFLISLISSLIILGIGIGLKFFQIGFMINNLFSKIPKKENPDSSNVVGLKKKIPKKEVSNVKQKTKSKIKNS
jgi:hypothetical protein